MAKQGTGINAAVKGLDANDDKLWEADGSPKLEVIRILQGDETLTAEDISKATAGFKRPGFVAKETPAAQSVVTVPVAEAETQESRNAADYDKARVRLADIEAKLDVAHNDRSKITLAIDDLVKLKDVELKIIERLAPSVSFAQGVKAIQKQTQERLAFVKDATAIAQAALRATGTNIYPSKLDEALALRKRGIEHTQAQVDYIRQRQSDQALLRG